VDRPERQSNTNYLHDFIQFYTAPKRLDNAVIRERYLKSGKSSAQIAEEFGVSKQMILGRLRQAGVHGAKGRGRSKENYRFPNPPYGYRAVSGRLETYSPEVKVARLIVELRDRHQRSFSEIAEALRRKKLRTRQGVAWTRFTVSHV
jgi:hypothetical protein